MDNQLQVHPVARPTTGQPAASASSRKANDWTTSCKRIQSQRSRRDDDLSNCEEEVERRRWNAAFWNQQRGDFEQCVATGEPAGRCDADVTLTMSFGLVKSSRWHLKFSDIKTMSFGLIDTTSFGLRAKIQQMLFAITSSGIRAHQTLGMAPFAPRTRATAALRMKQIALDNQDRTIRHLRAQLATERRGLAVTKKELKETQVALEASHKVTAGLTEIGLSMSKKIEKMKVKKHLVKANHVECHQKFQARIHEAEDSMQAQHLLIEALVDEKDSLLCSVPNFDMNEEQVEEEEQDQFWGW
ncbi:hypothetical protein F511_19857 [Dorcoceras hygrometricum]|uniref:Uncharacterized protein n=1 Tax=Dorcoceras hygrometricum TaxID=472368 RepID=A0A2Z7CVR9_9LAMI|nr:hypothetical protein F511_19857 [Dorcoceras hygrometricum]